MTILIKIPTGLRRFAENTSSLSVEADTVSDALLVLAASYPNLANKAMSKDGQLKSFVRVFVNTQAIAVKDFEQVKLTKGDEIALMTAIAGG